MNYYRLDGKLYVTDDDYDLRMIRYGEVFESKSPDLHTKHDRLVKLPCNIGIDLIDSTHEYPEAKDLNLTVQMLRGNDCVMVYRPDERPIMNHPICVVSHPGRKKDRSQIRFIIKMYRQLIAARQFDVVITPCGTTRTFHPIAGAR